MKSTTVTGIEWKSRTLKITGKASVTMMIYLFCVNQRKIFSSLILADEATLMIDFIKCTFSCIPLSSPCYYDSMPFPALRRGFSLQEIVQWAKAEPPQLKAPMKILHRSHAPTPRERIIIEEFYQGHNRVKPSCITIQCYGLFRITYVHTRWLDGKEQFGIAYTPKLKAIE